MLLYPRAIHNASKAEIDQGLQDKHKQQGFIHFLQANPKFEDREQS
jgi:hypothetical protein